MLSVSYVDFPPVLSIHRLSLSLAERQRNEVTYKTNLQRIKFIVN